MPKTILTSYITIFLWILFLTAINAFFVAAEMAYSRVRRTHIEQLAAEGNNIAQRVQRYFDDPETYFAGSQLGITIAMLVIGAIGESFFAEDLAHHVGELAKTIGWSADFKWWAQATCYIVVFLLTAFLQTIFGELLPKLLTFQRAETVLMWTVIPMHIWCTITKPLIFVMNATQKFVVKLLKVPEPPKHMMVYSEDELKLLVSASHEQGVLEEQEEEMLHSVFEFGETSASEVMTPRRDMKCLAADRTVQELVDLALKHGHSRIPIFEKDVDSIFGFVHIRDGLRAYVEGKSSSHVRELARKILIVPENKSLQDLLTEFKRQKTHVAIVIDEHGGTEGMVTFEDLLEELVGEIADEHDVEAEYILQDVDGSLIIDARMDLEEANEQLGLAIEDEEFTTLGGHVFGALGHEPQVGDELSRPEYTLRIEEADRHRITKLRLIRHEPDSDSDDDGFGNGVPEGQKNGATRGGASARQHSASQQRQTGPQKQQNSGSHKQTDSGANKQVNSGANKQVNSGAYKQVNSGANKQVNSGANKQVSSNNKPDGSAANKQANTGAHSQPNERKKNSVSHLEAS